MQKFQKKRRVAINNVKGAWVISDIHGCSKTFKALIEKINLSKQDYLFLLGDYIDKGPDSVGVLDYILNLQRNNFQVFPLRGNHEQNLLETYEEYDAKQFRFFVEKMNKSKGLITEDGKIISRFREFIEKLPYYYELENFYLAHAGFDFRNENPLENYPAMLHVRFLEADLEILKGKKVIHGHQPTYLEDIKKAICGNAPMIPLDNGCVYTKNNKYIDANHLKNLCALNLKTMELVLQENVE